MINSDEVKQLLEYFEKYPSRGALAWQVAYNLRIKKFLNFSPESFKEAHRLFVIQHPGAVSKRTNGYKRNHAKIEHTERNISKPQSIHKIPKILIFDLETAPMVSYHFGRHKVNIGLENTISESFIICYTAKWLWDEKLYTDCATPEEMLRRSDYRVCNSLWSLIDQADIVVAHNGIRADCAWFNSRCLINGLTPPSPYRVIDTLQIVKKKFGFSSNKLDALAGYIAIDHKLDTNFTLWSKCMEGDQESLDYMQEYNKHDVTILEEVFIQLMPWINSMMSNMSTMLCEDCCPTCGSTDYKATTKYYYTPLNKYLLYQCSQCGCWFRDRKADKDYKPIFSSVVY